MLKKRRKLDLKKILSALFPTPDHLQHQDIAPPASGGWWHWYKVCFNSNFLCVSLLPKKVSWLFSLLQACFSLTCTEPSWALWIKLDQAHRVVVRWMTLSIWYREVAQLVVVAGRPEAGSGTRIVTGTRLGGAAGPGRAHVPDGPGGRGPGNEIVKGVNGTVRRTKSETARGNAEDFRLSRKTTLQVSRHFNYM